MDATLVISLRCCQSCKICGNIVKVSGNWMAVVARAGAVRTWVPTWPTLGCGTKFCTSGTWRLFQHVHTNAAKPYTNSRMRCFCYRRIPVLPTSFYTLPTFKDKCISEVDWESVVQPSFIWVTYEEPSSSHCVVWYLWWGYRGNLKLIPLTWKWKG